MACARKSEASWRSIEVLDCANDDVDRANDDAEAARGSLD